MNDKPSIKLDELLAQATESLRGAVSIGPSRELKDLTIDMIRSLETDSQISTTASEAVLPSERIYRSLHLVRYGALAGAALVCALIAGWWILMDRTAMPAFAEVMQQVAKGKSVTFVTEGISRNNATDENVRERVKWYVQGQQIRVEETGGSVATIADLEQEQIYRVDMKRKMATMEPLVDELAEMIVNPLAQVQKLNAEDAKLIGSEVLDGRIAHVYQLNTVKFLMIRTRGTMKVWVDRDTHLPVRIEVEPKTREGRTVRIEMSDFEWNKGLDASLFRVPEGYTMVDAQQFMRERQERKPVRN